TLQLSSGGKIIARALQVYGAWVGDTGSMAALDAQEFVKLDQWGNPNIDSSPWQGLLTYRDLYNNFPVNKLRVVAANSADFYVETDQTTLSSDTSSGSQAPTPTQTATPRAPLVCVNTSGTVKANGQFISVGTFNLLQGEVVTFNATHS